MRFLPIVFLALAASTFAADPFVEAPEHRENPAVPHGVVTKMPPWESQIFPGTTRDWAIYVPAQCKPGRPAALMIFLDGHDYLGPKGNWRVPTVFDNLIAEGAMPPTIAVFIDPGQDKTKPKPTSAWKNNNRSLEYNSLGDRNARFLIDEILPEVAKNHLLSPDPELRAIAGVSSGGIAAFTVAWERPDQFRKVLSTVGSFVNLAGGNAYPSIIRKTEHKPLRVFLEDATGDLDNPFGNWPIANKQMFAALTYMKYDVRFDLGEGYSHGSVHGGSIFPESLRWLWRDAVKK